METTCFLNYPIKVGKLWEQKIICGEVIGSVYSRKKRDFMNGVLNLGHRLVNIERIIK